MEEAAVSIWVYGKFVETQQKTSVESLEEKDSTDVFAVLIAELR
jgi:hypothetical protein